MGKKFHVMKTFFFGDCFVQVGKGTDAGPLLELEKEKFLTHFSKCLYLNNYIMERGFLISK